ncbi:MAG TPA: dihydrolipoamide acetyltransferase family protein [Trueperaceae bacterium]
MPREFLLPELAESVVEGEIVKWLVAEGETVEEDQPIVEVMTDKVTVELPSPYAGVLEKQLVAEGDVVPVHQPIALFSEDGAIHAQAAAPSVQAREERSIVEPGGTDSEDDGESLSLFKPIAETDEGPAVQVRRGRREAAARATGPYGRVLAVPAARKLARQQGVAIEDVPGSGPNGRVRVTDVEAYLAQPAQAPRGIPATEHIPYRTPAGYEELEERTPLRGMRRAISNQMLASHLQSVRTLHVDEADVSALVAMRQKLKPLAEKRGVKLSYLPFIMKAVVASLKAYPMLNASLDETANEIVRKHYYNLGVAVATDVGLVVPVVHDVDQKSVLELAREVAGLAEKARAGKLTADDVRGGTFSITNIGSLGGLFSFPIINVPEAAILGVHSIKKRPVVLPDDSIAARQMLYLSMSFDHRLVDGAEAAMFTTHLIELLETPESLMLEG